MQVVGSGPGGDPIGRRSLELLRDMGVHSVRQVACSHLYTLRLAGPSREDGAALGAVIGPLLADPVTEAWQVWSNGQTIPAPEDGLAVEVHLRPGVMDSVGDSTRRALAELGIRAESVRTARRFVLFPVPSDRDLVRIPRILGNPSIEEVVLGGKPVSPPPTPPVNPFQVRRVQLREAGDGELARLSSRGHLFLTTEEMRAIQQHFRTLGRDPTDLELETLAQTWSEHCVHKTLKSAVVYRGEGMPGENANSPKRQDTKIGGTGAQGCQGPEVQLRYENLLRDTIARATDELIREGRGPECLSVFKDNAGVVAFDDTFGVAFKVETHNRPSAIEPYGGASTGIGGVIRDVLGCGLGARPIAGTDVFCVAPPDWPIDAVPKGVIHPRAVLQGITAGVRDYGNRMGIPTVNGAVHFDPRYLGNPLVYCGCIGLIPRDRIEKRARPGDLIVLMGGRTGRDGIHGATFSSAELTDTHEDEFAHAVQIGNAIEEKKVLDVILQARDYSPGWHSPAQPGRGEAENGRCLFSSITDCGAGGLSSAIGEMAAELGAEVDLERVPLKYAGLRYDEIWISEAQERMVLAAPPENVDALLKLAAAEDVEATVIGRFTDTRRLVVRFEGQVVGDLELHFLHEGIPKAVRTAEWAAPKPQAPSPRPLSHPGDVAAELKRRLSDPTTASKHWFIRQYDHEVGGRSVVKPLNGPGDGPSDAAVIRPRLDSHRGIAIGCGLAPDLAEIDPYWMAVAAIDEAIRNVVCVGGDPARTAILDNFCWPRVDNPRHMGAMVRACQACYDAAKAYGVPFISGKDSLNNEFVLDAADVELVRAVLRRSDGTSSAGEIVREGRIAIPYTLLISALAMVEDVRRCVTARFKQPESQVFVIGRPMTFNPGGDSGRSLFDCSTAARTHQAVAGMIREGVVCAVHDVSDGGTLASVAEMCIASHRGCRLHPATGQNGAIGFFDALPACYVVELANGRRKDLERLAGDIPKTHLATLEPAAAAGPVLEFDADGHSTPPVRVTIAELATAWKAPLDW